MPAITPAQHRELVAAILTVAWCAGLPEQPYEGPFTFDHVTRMYERMWQELQLDSEDER